MPKSEHGTLMYKLNDRRFSRWIFFDLLGMGSRVFSLFETPLGQMNYKEIVESPVFTEKDKNEMIENHRLWDINEDAAL